MSFDVSDEIRPRFSSFNLYSNRMSNQFCFRYIKPNYRLLRRGLKNCFLWFQKNFLPHQWMWKKCLLTFKKQQLNSIYLHHFRSTSPFWCTRMTAERCTIHSTLHPTSTASGSTPRITLHRFEINLLDMINEIGLETFLCY